MAVGIVFDCDGTLLDSMAAWSVTENRLASAAGARLTLEDSESLCRMTIPEAGRFFHDSFGLCSDANGVVRMIDEMMLDYYRYRVTARPGAVEFVRDLIRCGVRCSVASSSPQRYLKAGLMRVGLWGLLSTVLSVDDVGASKREPTIYRRAMQEMGTVPETSWGIDDSTYALEAMNDVGMSTVGMCDCDERCAFAQLEATARIAVHSFDELDVRMFAEKVW